MKTNLRFHLALAMICLPVGFLARSFALRDDVPSDSSRARADVLRPFVDRHALAGAVTLVADKDKVLSLEAVGYADVDARKPMTTDALFWIASQTKSMTASGLMMLVDERKVKLDDPVAKYLPEFKGQWLRAYGDNQVQLLKKPKQSMTPLDFEPGTKHFQYSNAGINTAGRIIEVVSRMPYEIFMDKRLFEPLGMKDTTFWPNEEQLKRLAKSYKPNDDKNDLIEIKIGQLKYPLDDRSRQPMPAGGLFSTATDVGRFCQMILNGGKFQGKRYLSENAVKQMATTQIGDPAKGGYGLGWSTHGDGVFGHGGAHATNMTIDPQHRLITVFMVQHAGFPKDGDTAHGAFQKAALRLYDSSRH
jgi:CubicO group peptidase (beta-lactamase class C family)